MPSGRLGAALTRHRVTAAVPSAPCSTFDARLKTNAVTPDDSAASCSRLEAVVEYFPTSPTTPAMPA